jgi:lysophospholipase L1-like esterase
VTTRTALETWVCLGDSLTHGQATSPTTVERPWPARIDEAIFPGRGAVDHGHTGTQLATDNVNGVSMQSHFDSDIVGRGYYGMVLWGGVNDVIFGRTGAQIWADYKALVDEAIADGMKVIAVITSPAAGYTGGWSGAKQTALETFRASALATLTPSYSANLVAVVDFYSAMGDPNAPTFLDEAWAGVADDGLHHGQAAQDEIILPTLIPLMEAAGEVAPSTTLYTYGVTASDVRKHHFPNSADFSDTSNPTSTTVTEKIADAAGELAGRLLKEDISPATIDAGGATYAPYVILRKVLRKMVALEIGPAMNEESKRLDRWARELKDFFFQLEEDAATALGDDTLTSGSSEASGPTTHIDQYNLDVGDPTTDASDAIPPFRKSDEL